MNDDNEAVTLPLAGQPFMSAAPVRRREVAVLALDLGAHTGP